MQQGQEAKKKRLSPLSELAIRLRTAKYTPTTQEFEALSKCKNEILSGYVKYPLLFGVLAGTVSYRLKFLTRAFGIAVASALGLEYGRQKAEYACMKHFCALEESPIKAELVAILQRDFPDHPLLQQVPERRSLYHDGDEAPVPMLALERKDVVASGEQRGLNTSSYNRADSEIPDRENQASVSRERPRPSVRGDQWGVGRGRAGNSRGTDQSEVPGDAADLLVDPFSICVWTETDGAHGDDHGNQTVKRREMRRSRMTDRERREHSRSLHERRDTGQVPQASS